MSDNDSRRNELDPLESFELIEWLKTRDPLLGQPTQPPVNEDPVAQRIYAQVVQEQNRNVPHDATGKRPKSWYAKRLLVPVLVAATLLLSAAALLRTKPAVDLTQVGCYNVASLVDASVVVLPLEKSPIAQCREAWQNPEYKEVFSQERIPSLATCVLEGGVVGVFPNEPPNVCERLGLAVWDEDLEPAELQQELVSRITSQFLDKCLALSDGAQIARNELEALGLSGWTVTVAPASEPEFVCASLAFDWAASSITIVPIANLWVD
ncbi:MAG: hypothetical protein WC184_01185 [Acidimicrobiia bacterium]